MILDRLVRDPDIAGLVGEVAFARAMAVVEGALARAEAGLGIIPEESATAISAAAEALEPAPGALAGSVEATGTPVQGLLRELRAAVGPPHDGYVHWGATSQDIVDTAMVLCCRRALDALDGRLRTVIRALADLARVHRATVMAARTRFQQAVPTSFGLRVATWIGPLLRHMDRLPALRSRLEAVQLGGAAGTLAAFDGRGAEVAAALARELGLRCPPGPWHSQRDSVAELGAWLALVAGGLAKVGFDAVLLAQTEVAEIAEGAEGHGGSSTMPQKANPVLAEALMAGGRLAAARLPSLYQALVHGGERDGAAWQMEWVDLPELFALAGGALANACALVERLQVDPDRMRRNMEAGGGLVFAERAAFRLARTMPLTEAQALVAEAAKAARSEGTTLAQALAARVGEDADLSGLDDLDAAIGEAGRIVDGILVDVQDRLADSGGAATEREADHG